MRIRFLSLLLFSFVAAASVHAVPLVAPLSLAGAVAQQSPEEYANYPASLAIDGNRGNFTHTLEECPDPWLTVTLPEAKDFSTVVIYNRTECCGERLQNITVTVYAGTDETVPLFTSATLNPDGVLGIPASLTVEFPSVLHAQKVKIRRQPGTGPAPGVLSIGEVELLVKMDDASLPLGTNLTRAGITTLTATQSTTLGGFAATNALDSVYSNFTHTLGDDTQAWWEADFGTEMRLQKLLLFNRAECCQGRMRDLTVTVYDAAHQEVWSAAGINPNNELASPAQLPVDIEALHGSPVTGRYVRITRAGLGGSSDDNNVLALAEVEITGGTVETTTPPAELPVLSITKEGTSATLSWPAAVTGFTLESSPNLQDPWTPVPGVSGNAVTLPANAGTLFFRLRKPS
ncbi:MAG TPA: discoidin domain-containing protein [Verrucomicrobiales bacterium]|nr:discoidin domain-containing protein [Verrucomicrobiales bacterium]